MKTNTTTIVDRIESNLVHRPHSIMLMLCFLILLALTGCQTKAPGLKGVAEQSANPPETVSLREGDILRISFPGAPNLNTTQQVRTDGKIDLSLVGEITVVGMTPAELEKELINRYSSQLLSKEVTVTIESSSIVVYVTGAVLRPGKVASARHISALEAIMEAGGPDYTKANLKTVTVTRLEEGQFKTYTLNLQSALEGNQTKPFYLKPSDIVKVPERFSWF